MSVSRRQFMGGVAAAVGYLGVKQEADLLAQQGAPSAAARMRQAVADDWDSYAHLSSNENCWGPPESVMKAMNSAWKYSNRYGYPDGNIVAEIAKLHGVKPENILITAGSGEILDVVGTTYLLGGKKVLGVEPSYSSVYQHATSIKTTAIKLPLARTTGRTWTRSSRRRTRARRRSASCTCAIRTTRPASSSRRRTK